MEQSQLRFVGPIEQESLAAERARNECRRQAAVRLAASNDSRAHGDAAGRRSELLRIGHAIDVPDIFHLGLRRGTGAVGRQPGG